MISRQAILDAKDLATATVHVDEWGDDVTVRMMTGTERHTLYAKANESGKFNLGMFTAMLATLTMVDADGARLFADDEVAIVAGKSASALQKVFEASAELNKLNTGAVDAATKNSGPTQSASSS